MKRITTISLAILMLFTFSFITVAQNRSSKYVQDENEQETTLVDVSKIGRSLTANIDRSNATLTPREGGLLWDNMLVVTGSIVSGQWGGWPVPDSNIVIMADDFVIPPGEKWTINEVMATGVNSVPPNILADFFGIRFYSDAGGSPGILLAEVSSVATTDTLVSGPLSSDVVLQEGTYWVSVYGVSDTAASLAEFRWNWDFSDGIVGEFNKLTALTDFFGPPFDWLDVNVLVPDANSCVFSLYGTSESFGNCVFMDDFEDSTLANWTITNDGGICDWVAVDITNNSYTLPAPASGFVMSADADACGSGTSTLSTATMNTPVDASLYQIVTIKFDNDWRTIDVKDEAHLEVSTDGGTTWSSVFAWVGVDFRDTHEVWDVSALAALQSSVLFRFRVVQPGWDWWWTVDNVGIYLDDLIPVELTSFVATVNNNDINLNWSTATETNNSGFEVQRSSNGSDFSRIAFVEGHGTVSEAQFYTFADQNLEVGSYTYRLKQIDFDGTSEFSDIVEVEIIAPDVFALAQNYPNPFNPSTKINFSLAADSRVTLTVFDVLGQEVVTLINGDLSAGSHDINFNAANFNSGVYFYRINATGVNGTNFTSVKKMILTK